MDVPAIGMVIQVASSVTAPVRASLLEKHRATRCQAAYNVNPEAGGMDQKKDHIEIQMRHLDDNCDGWSEERKRG